MKRKALQVAGIWALLIQACTTEETYEPPDDDWVPERELSLSWPCLDCISTIGGGQCADELDACEADLDCWFMFVGLRDCEAMSALWTQEAMNACGQGAIFATSLGSMDLACDIYWCTWGYGNPPQEWLSCLQGSCNPNDNAIMSHVADYCDWS